MHNLTLALILNLFPITNAPGHSVCKQATCISCHYCQEWLPVAAAFVCEGQSFHEPHDAGVYSYPRHRSGSGIGVWEWGRDKSG